MAYALGKFAKGLCDRCAFEYKLHELREEWNGAKVCPQCYEPKHPQLEPLTATADPEAEEEPLLLGLDDIRTDFLAAFANPPREPETEFAPSVRGALFVLNGPRVLSWIPAQPGNLAERLNQQSANYANTLYLAVLSRNPTAVEQDHFDSFISNHPDKTAAIEQAIWALLASNEFAINH